MSKTPEQMLAESRSYSTDNERKVLALEAIADQLQLLVAALQRDGGASFDIGTQPVDRNLRAVRAWENEGGSLEKAGMDTLGIKHSVIDQFEVGGYRYSKLEDAIAQAHRAGKQ